ncbi:hypothetical protein [Teichococcus oryzae]|uniref:Uncharacterized protein n=1 Tax=Teichococcus oryzae TaxID=1608942 RepID=A0A5B2TGP9_9PROT|nr:hypothetical protein [Pseudoroseomonas oryzae]KAA2213284.1 hypothetical protein F0Q34_11730 [Pseudoroseomonas oryzae]
MEQPNQVTIEIGDTRHIGNYVVEGDLVTVTSEEYGNKESARLDGADPHDLAQTLLREMVRRKEDL